MNSMYEPSQKDIDFDEKRSNSPIDKLDSKVIESEKLATNRLK